MTDRTLGAIPQGGSELVPIDIAAVSMQPTITDPCEFPNFDESTGASNVSPNINYLEYPASGATFSQFSYAAPHNWDLGRLFWSVTWTHSGAASNFDVAWRIKAVAINDDEAMSTNYVTEHQITGVGGTNDNLYISDNDTPQFITVAGNRLPHSRIFFSVFRVPTDGADTLVTAARLKAITLYFRLTQRRHV